MRDEPEKYSVVIRVRSLTAVQHWCDQNVPRPFQPTFTARENTNGEQIVRATFTNQHYAALFKLFWLDSK